MVRCSVQTCHRSSPRYWSAQSEEFTGLDSLLCALCQGWEINQVGFQHKTYQGRTRPISLYYFELKRKDEMATMAVTSSPRLDAFIKQHKLQMISSEEVRQTVEDQVSES